MRYSLGLVFTRGASTISNIRACVGVHTKYLNRKWLDENTDLLYGRVSDLLSSQINFVA